MILPDYSKSPILGLSDEEWADEMAESQHRANMDTMPQVDALLKADWKIAFFDMSETGLELWQWKWRRPARRSGSKGRLFLSTNQAYNALMRERNAK